MSWEDGRMKGRDERQARNVKAMEDERTGGVESGDERV